ncbi:hypothetical protein ABN584_27675 [Gloeocapsa sp. BRSZ]
MRRDPIFYQMFQRREAKEEGREEEAIALPTRQLRRPYRFNHSIHHPYKSKGAIGL